MTVGHRGRLPLPEAPPVSSLRPSPPPFPSVPHMRRDPLRPGDRVGDVTILAIHGSTVDLRCERLKTVEDASGEPSQVPCGRIEKGRNLSTIQAARAQARCPSCKPCGREANKRKRHPVGRYAPKAAE